MDMFASLIGAAAKKFIKSVIGSAKESSAQGQSAAARAVPAYDPKEPVIYVGGDMPDEENQFSFNGSYADYFDTVYKAEFPDYQIVHAPARDRLATIFTFSKDGSTALIVELLSETSSAKKLRASCAAAGIPYLRFYYDHHGWWNTRSYVVGRTKAALGI